MAAQIPANFRRVITAAAGGNVIEWYDFYIFGSLAAILSVKFFEKSHPVAALLSTIALFTAGFLVRPLGAFVFGWLALGGVWPALGAGLAVCLAWSGLLLMIQMRQQRRSSATSISQAGP